MALSMAELQYWESVVSICISIYNSKFTYLYMYIYICTERERERYIYMYIHIWSPPLRHAHRLKNTVNTNTNAVFFPNPILELFLQFENTSVKHNKSKNPKSKNPKIQRSKNLKIQKSKNPKIQKSKNLKSKNLKSKIKKSKNPKFLHLRNLAFFLDFWMFGFLDF